MSDNLTTALTLAACALFVGVAFWRVGLPVAWTCVHCGERIRESHLNDDGSWACRRRGRP